MKMASKRVTKKKAEKISSVAMLAYLLVVLNRRMADRRREKQVEYNAAHGIVPQPVVRPVMDVMEGARAEPGESRGGKAGRGKAAARQVAEPAGDYAAMDPTQAARRIQELEQRMYQHARDLEFEDAAQVRDQIRRIREAALGA